MDPSGWTLKEIARKLKRIDPRTRATDGSLGLFLGPADEIPVPSNTTLMPALNKLLKIAPPPVCDPDSPLAQIQDRFAAKWKSLTPNERRAIKVLLADPDDIDL